jgi:hypothetical protein
MITDKRHARGQAFAIRFRAVIETDLARVDAVGAAKRRGERMEKNKRNRTRERGTDARVARRVGRAQRLFRSPRNRPTRRLPTDRFVFRSHTQAASLAAATAVVLSATPAFALNSIELTDKRAENQSGLQLIYEVRHPTR